MTGITDHKLPVFADPEAQVAIIPLGAQVACQPYNDLRAEIPSVTWLSYNRALLIPSDV